MISDSKASDIYNYFATNDKNEEIELLKGNEQDVQDALEDGIHYDRKNAIRHFQLSSKEPLTNEQFKDLIKNYVQKELNISDDDILLASIHTYTDHESDRDPRHLHLAIRLVDPENGNVKRFDNLYQRQEKIARMFEVDNGLELVKGRHNVAVWHNVPDEYKDKLFELTQGELPNSFLRDGQYQKQQRNGMNSFDIRNTCKELVKNCDNLQAFAGAISEYGWTIEQGQKKLILNDENGKLVGSVDRILGMKKDEFEKFKGDYEVAKIEVASPTVGDTISPDKLARVAPVDPSEAVQKPTNEAQEPSQEQAPANSQTAPEQPEIGSNAETINEAKAEISDGMSREEKLAISEFNKQQSEKEKETKEELANQTKRAKQMLEDMQKNKKPELKPSWTDTLDDREKILVDIIDQPHPKLRTITDKQVRNFLYKNFKEELDDFYKDRKKYMELRKEIKELQQKDKWYHFIEKSKLSKKEKEEQEKIKKLMLMAVYLVHCMMHRIGLNTVRPNPYDYLTEQQKREYEIQYKKDKLAQKLLQNSDRAKCLDSIAVLKVFERDSELMKWKSRDEVIHAKLAMQKLNIVRDVNILTLDQQGQDEFKKAQESLDIEKARKAVIEAHKREENRYLLDVRPDEKEETIEQNQEKEKSNVVQFPKNNNIKKKKSFSYGR